MSLSKKIFIYIVFFCFFITNKIYAKYIFISNENSDTVTVLDVESKKLIKSIETGGRPRDMKFNKEQSLLYVVVSEENHIAVIDIDKLEIIYYIDTGDDPEIFDIDPDGNIIAVSNEDDNQLTLIDIKTKKIIKTIEDVGVEPEGVNFSPDGKFVYVTSEGTNSVIIIDPWKHKIVNEILVGNRPRRGLFIKNGEEYWVSNELSGNVSIIDTKTQKIIKNLDFELKGIRKQNITPVDFAYSQRKGIVFVTLGSANHVAVVEIEGYKVKKNILTGARVWGAALNSNATELIVTNGNSDDISVIDVDRLVSNLAIPVGKTPHTVRIMN